MAFHRTISVVMLLALASTSTTAVADETNRETHVEATLPQAGTVMVAGFGSLWMMSTATNRLVRIHPGDNSVTEIPISGAVGPFWASGMAVGDDGIWVPDIERSMIYKIDPLTNQVAKEIPADLVGGRGPGGKFAIAVGEGAVWAIASNNELRRYSAGSGIQFSTIGATW